MFLYNIYKLYVCMDYIELVYMKAVSGNRFCIGTL